MNVSGQFTVQAPREVVFNTIRDPRTFVGLVEGVSELQTAVGGGFRGAPIRAGKV